MSESVIVSERAGGKYTNEARVRDHHLYIDEPLSFGSADLGPTPIELLATALAGCTSITMRMYADRKKWPLEHIEVEVNYKKAGNTYGERDIFHRKIVITGDLDETQRTRLYGIAENCPVHNILEANAEVKTELS